MNVIQTPGRLKLEKDIILLEDEIESLKENLEEDRVELKKEALGSLRDRLNKLSKLQLSVDQLLYQAQRCEASLQNTRIQLATIRAGSTKTSVDSVIEALQERINQVKEVQEEFNKLGY
jgi:predicted  nucleic acid-binding Zn-ribbon protein